MAMLMMMVTVVDKAKKVLPSLSLGLRLSQASYASAHKRHPTKHRSSHRTVVADKEDVVIL
jgi:hypothetical protein